MKLEYDDNNNTLYYYVCEMYENGHVCDRTYHRKYSKAMMMGDYWVYLTNSENRDYTVEEIEIDFYE